MLIATLLAPPQLLRMTDAAHDLPATLSPARDWSHLHHLLRERPLSLVVVDPAVGNVFMASQIMHLLTHWPSTPVIVYTQFTPNSIRMLSVLGKRGLRDVILYQYDDARLRLGRRLRRATALRFVARLRAGLIPALDRLPVHVAAAVDDLLDRPHAFQAGADLATASGAPRRSLQRALHQAGLTTPRQLLMAARVAHAVTYLRDPGLRIQDVADKLGYTRADILVRHTVEILGVRPNELRRSNAPERLQEDHYLACLLAWTCRTSNSDDPRDD